MPELYRYLRVRLQMEQQRFLNFGLASGILYEDGEICAALQINRSLLLAVLAEINSVLETYATANGKYERLMPQEIVDWADHGEPQVELMDLLCPPSEQKSQGTTNNTRKKRLNILKHARALGENVAQTGRDLRTIIVEPKRLVWAAVDKDSFESLISKIEHLNSFLIALLDSSQVRRLQDMMSTTYLEVLQMRNDLESLAGLVRALHTTDNKTQNYGASAIGADSNPFSRAVAQETEAHESKKEYLKQLVEVKIQHTRMDQLISESSTSSESSKFIGTLLRLEEFSFNDEDLKWSNIQKRTIATYQGRRVWIEWKYILDDDSSTTSSELVERRIGLLTGLLCREKPIGFRAPPCLGYTKDTDEDNGVRFGIVFDTPGSEGAGSELFALRDLYERKPKPSLSARMSTCAILARCIHSFHAVNWLHKGLQSNNIVFFASSANEQDLTRPFVSGFELSRPSTADTLTEKRTLDPFADVYRHPDVQSGRTDGSFRKSCDICSLGIAFVEIAFWKRIEDVVGVESLGKMMPSALAEVQSWLLGRPFSRTSWSKGREKVLGKEHEHTLWSKHWLGLVLYYQQKYAEAEEVLRQAVQGRENVVGKERAETLDSKHWLAESLDQQQKYLEAEEVLRHAVEGREKVLGRKHEDTLDSKDTLGIVLYEQQKYQEAEEVLRYAAQGRAEVLGKEHENTLWSKGWLGLVLYKQQKYREAEEMLLQVVQKDMEHVFTDDYSLETKRLLREVQLVLSSLPSVDKTASTTSLSPLAPVEKTTSTLALFPITPVDKTTSTLSDHLSNFVNDSLPAGSYSGGPNSDLEVTRTSTSTLPDHLGNSFPAGSHSRSLYSNSEIARTSTSTLPGHLSNSSPAGSQLLAPSRQTPDDKTISTLSDHLSNSSPAGSQLLAPSPLTPVDKTTSTPSDHLSNFFLAESHSRDPYSDSEIARISSLLKHLNQRWAKVPRTYIVLRTIKCLEHLDDFIDLGFSDHWLPATERSLPQCLRPSPRRAFVDAQHLVLTESMDLERGEQGQHCYFQRDGLIPFDTKGVLGSGGFGQVDRVLSSISFKEYARKTVRRRTAFRARGTEQVKSLIAEIQILKRLKHGHVVEFVGSYTDHKYICLIMSPVAEMDLSTYLARADASKRGELRTFFGCLARALEFLHEENVRHKDIKPGNILVDRGKVLLTDFGLSFDFVDANGSTSVGMVKGITPRYCAPEVAMLEPRNTCSDIWSLGVVFLEMVVVLKGKRVNYIDDFFGQHGSLGAYVRTNRAAFLELVAELEATESISDNRALVWIEQMLQMEQGSRPTAAKLILSISNASRDSAGFCGLCCTSRDDEISDADDDHFEDARQ
ncbi:hypothetical protein LTR28_009894 [Elasticomyces elasticus]|nr:hypothetical protein LTR28_009894 [Elasticomyces elasticus]